MGAAWSSPSRPPDRRGGRIDFILVSLYAVAVCVLSIVGAGRDHLLAFFGAACVMALAAGLLYRRNRLSISALLAIGVAARISVFWLPPGLSDDAFRYLWDGLVQHAGYNPYAFTPDELSALHPHALFGLLNSPAYFSVYPPLSQALFWLSTWGMGDDWTTAWYLWKGWCLLAECGTLWLLRPLGSRALLLYALHPLPIVELVGQAHTEALMVFGLALACHAARQNRVIPASLGWAAATLTKLFPVLLAPFLICRKRDIWPVVAALLIVGVTGLLYVQPGNVAHIASSLRLYTQYFEFNAGPYFAAKEVLLVLTGSDFSKQLGPLFMAVFIGIFGVLLIRHARSPRPFPVQAYSLMAAYLLCSTTVHPWYLSSILVLLPFNRVAGWSWQLLALVSLATYVRYTGGPYMLVVAAGWISWLFLTLWALWQSRRYSSP